jgi:hypothetical protein
MFLRFITKLISPETFEFCFFYLKKKQIQIQNIKMLLSGLITKHIFIKITITLLSLFITKPIWIQSSKILLSLFLNSDLKHKKSFIAFVSERFQNELDVASSSRFIAQTSWRRPSNSRRRTSSSRPERRSYRRFSRRHQNRKTT